MTSAVSIEFLGWLVATTVVFWAAPATLRQYVLMVSTVCVLALVDPRSLLALSVMTTIVIVATRFEASRQVVALLAGCMTIMAVLIALMFLDANNASTAQRLIPLGLAYYSLRCVHVLLERYRERIDRPSMSQLINYLFFPATLLAGPINRFDDYIAKTSSSFKADQFSAGLERILYGYVKIVVLSNYLLSTKVFPWLLSLLEPAGAPHHYLQVLDYGLALYLQFSGYSDIAIGFALLLGHKVIENFSWPFLKTNIDAFWRSWHISLTELSREYVFPSVQAATGRAWVAVVAMMLAISLWHGLTMNYLVWGIYHAAGLLVYRTWNASATAAMMRGRLPTSVNSFLGWLLTFQFVMLGFIFTKEVSLAESFYVFGILLAGVFGGV